MPPDAATRYDVAILGGGPAGACAAIRLADLGHRVVLVERAAFPRTHVGEALSPGVAVQLDHLGLGGRLAGVAQARFAGSELDWDGGGWTARSAHPAAMTVDRGVFDAMLLDAATRRGAAVLQPATVRRCERDAAGWALEIDAAGGPTHLHARFLIDATGRGGFLPRRRERHGAATFALHGYWQGATPALPRVAAGRDHWLWGSPVPGRGYSAILFLDRRRLGRGVDRDALYRRLTCERLIPAGAVPVGGVRLCDASSYLDARLAGPDFLKIGEAAFAIDPLSSSGVQKAVGSALTAAIVVNTLLRRPADADLALEFYRDEQARTVARHAGWAASVYAERTVDADDPFWRARVGAAVSPPVMPPRAPHPHDRLSLSPDARLAETPVLAAAFVERQCAVFHPALDRPIAFVGGVPIAPLLRDAATGSALAARFGAVMSPAAARSTIARLVATGVLVAAG